MLRSLELYRASATLQYRGCYQLLRRFSCYAARFSAEVSMVSLRAHPVDWDIFCTVIDNFGDIGVTWRLARQLVRDAGQRVRLWVDDLESFRRIAPGLDPALMRQTIAGVEIWRWRDAPPDGMAPGRVVIEAFACQLPAGWEAAMAASKPAPVWLNLEYLTAEDWIDGCHGLPSPQPRLGLTKHFFFPGFSETSGGLLCEHGLLDEREAWLGDTTEQLRYWASLGLPLRAAGELRVSLFCYESPSLISLLTAFAAGATPITALVPEGRALADVARFLKRAELAAGEQVKKGALTVKVLPMTGQVGYDHLLWACDLNLVRGEDSFLRAQWAGRPMLWHIYRQDEGAHLVKLDAFLDRYTEPLPAAAGQAMRQLCQAFNRDEDVSALWPAFAGSLPELAQHARDWPQIALKNGDLVTRLVQFCENRIQ
jgi:uncharacterized repeat protein (TIGR03837 family)